MFKYGDYLVFTHGMVFHAGYSTITYVDPDTYEIDEEILYGPYGISSSIMASGKIIGTLTQQFDETHEGTVDTSKIIVFDLASRDGVFKDLTHFGGQIRYDPDNEYVLIAPPEGGDIYVYTLDSILNG
jgi:hypothetical protein